MHAHVFYKQSHLPLQSNTYVTMMSSESTVHILYFFFAGGGGGVILCTSREDSGSENSSTDTGISFHRKGENVVLVTSQSTQVKNGWVRNGLDVLEIRKSIYDSNRTTY